MSIKINAFHPLIAALALLISIGVLVHLQQRTVPEVPASAQADVFSGERAFNQLSELLREGRPHSVDTQANRVVEQRIIERLRELGYREEVQAGPICRGFEGGANRFGYSRCTTVRNIIVHIPGRVSGPGILLSAHYDSVPAAPGASDAGAAVASLLEIARLLSLQEAPRNSIVLLFNEGEETGLHGAMLFMEQHPLARQLRVAINIEARGTTSRSVLFETGENSGWLINHYAATTPAPLSSSLFYEIYKVLPNDTDLTVYKQHGLQGVNFAHADNEPHYHTPLDNLDNLDRGSLQHHGDNAWGILNRIKDIDLTQVNPGNLVYTDILGFTLISWPQSVSPWLVLLLSIVYIATAMVLYRRQLWRFKATIMAFSLIVLTTFACALLSYAAQWLVQTASGHAQPWRAQSLPMEIGLWFLCVSVGLIAGLFSRRWQKLDTLIALQGWWLLFAAASGSYLPGVSFLFILPLAISLLAAVAYLFFNNIKVLPTITHLSLPVTAAVVFLPIAYFIEIAVGFQIAAVVGVFLSFIAVSLLSLPPLSQISRQALAGLTGLFLGIAIAGFTWTTLQAPYTSFKPQPLNLLYLQNDDNARLVVEAMEQYIPPELSRELGATTLAPAMPWTSAQYPVVDISSLALSPMSAEVVSFQSEGDISVVTLDLHSGNQLLNATTLLIPADSGLQAITWHDQEMEYQDTQAVGDNQYIFQCLGESCGQQRLQLRFAALETTNLTVAAHRSGLPPALRAFTQARNGVSIERQSGDQTIVFSKVTLP